MAWVYNQRTGQIWHNGLVMGAGYSGHGQGKNNPLMEQIKDMGPIPRGTYRIDGAYNHIKLGPMTMNLDPLPGTETFGRGSFRIHGDDIEHPGCGSDGCIVQSRLTRETIAESDDRILDVIA
jgi:Protein of unknown function (DUF2778)